MEGVECQDPQGAMYLFPRLRLPPKAIEAAAEAAGTEEEANVGNDKSQDDDLAVKEPVKASKKGKKSSKGKKRNA